MPDSLSECIRRARGHIEQRGWCQGKLYDEVGRVCLRRAFDLVGYGAGFVEQEFLGGAALANFNDAHGRTQSEVLELLDRAIAKAESDAR